MRAPFNFPNTNGLHKLIVERPRLLRAQWKNKKTALRLTDQQSAQATDAAEDYDSGPRLASSRRHEKWLNENLAPLRRYLMRQVGRPWDKVYGEIRKTIDTRPSACTRPCNFRKSTACGFEWNTGRRNRMNWFRIAGVNSCGHLNSATRPG